MFLDFRLKQRQKVGVNVEDALNHCRCDACGHSSRMECVRIDCNCCNLEDMFTLLSHVEFDPHHEFRTHTRKLIEA